MELEDHRGGMVMWRMQDVEGVGGYGRSRDKWWKQGCEMKVGIMTIKECDGGKEMWLLGM